MRKKEQSPQEGRAREFCSLQGVASYHQLYWKKHRMQLVNLEALFEILIQVLKQCTALWGRNA